MGLIESTIRNMCKGIYDFTNNGDCSSCGQCCSNFIPLSCDEIIRIKKYIKSHGIKPCNHFLPTVDPLPDMTCPFRDNNKKICTIYKIRPVICREFKCDKAKKGFKPCKEILDGEFKVVNMRKLFSGKD